MSQLKSNDNGQQSMSKEQIEKIADKVYMLWKRDLQLLRERRRIHGRSFPKR